MRTFYSGADRGAPARAIVAALPGQRTFACIQTPLDSRRVHGTSGVSS
jgi:hypothetical protein